ncbi:glycosyltransferase family 2 protein [Leptobacterium sp. I13]|uniref:glycosyltransferase family 2 protein n=1 Tax=Leptobacterium meishanense TaxID=3128904 RepID=UPI0030ECC32C
MNIAIVILNWNGKALLETFLPSVVNYSEKATVYLADNASEDDSVTFVKTNYPNVVIIKNSENGGYAKGYNDALRHIEADIYCLLNSDVAVSKNWLLPIMDLFEKDEDIAIIQPKILDYRKKEYFEYAGAGGGFIDQLGYPYCRGRIFQSIEKDSGQYDDTIPVFWASGACMFVRSAVFWELGGFDEDYFAHQEEVDFCWRTHNKGFKVMYTGKSHVYHLGGATLSNMDPKKTFLNFRNSLFSITKNLPKRKVIVLVFLRLILDGIAVLRFILLLKPRHALSVLYAHISYYKNMQGALKKRPSIAGKRKYYSIKSIVWNYFILNKKTYGSLIKY